MKGDRFLWTPYTSLFFIKTWLYLCQMSLHPTHMVTRYIDCYADLFVLQRMACMSTEFPSLVLKHLIVHSSGALCTTAVHDFYFTQDISLSFLLKSVVFLSRFRHVRKFRKSNCYLRHVCPSVHPSSCPHGTTGFPLKEFSWKLIILIINKCTT